MLWPAGAVLPGPGLSHRGRVRRGPIHELPGAFQALSSVERELVSEIRRDPRAAVELLWGARPVVCGDAVEDARQPT